MYFPMSHGRCHRRVTFHAASFEEHTYFSHFDDLLYIDAGRLTRASFVILIDLAPAKMRAISSCTPRT